MQKPLAAEGAWDEVRDTEEWKQPPAVSVLLLKQQACGFSLHYGTLGIAALA